MDREKIVIVGGVAGGASCAARARRLSEEVEIVVFDRGPYASFANCGLPYYVGDVIRDEEDLLVATPELFRDRFNIDVRCENEVLDIDRVGRQIQVKDSKTGVVYKVSYDYLVLATGAAPIRPSLPGIDLPGIFSLRTIPDSRRIKEWITEHQAARATVIGGSFIGLEMAENLARRGIAVRIVERLDQVMPSLDPEMVVLLHDYLRECGIELCLGEMVEGFATDTSGQLIVNTDLAEYPTDLVIMAIGVRPETGLARKAGLALGGSGGIRVDGHMQTSDPRIWAVGDAVEVRSLVAAEWSVVPLAGPANRQGRVAAENIFGRDTLFRGVQGTTVCGVFAMTLAATGANERTLKRLVMPYEKVYLHPGHHVGYYPGAKPIHMKLLFSPEDGRILGAQAVGWEGVEKRIDVLSLALQKGMSVYDLEEAELCYAPQFGAAKDPVNIAGMIAVNAIRGDAPVARWEDLEQSGALILDVRDADEYAEGHVAGAVHIPLAELRERMVELPTERAIWVYCQVGQRAYYATRALRLNGYDALNLSGGFATYEAWCSVRKSAAYPVATTVA